jgi:hypothetical protein
MAVVAEKPRVVIVTSHVIGGEVQSILRHLPIRNQLHHVVVHGYEWIGVELLAHCRQLPPALVEGERREIEGGVGGNGEVVADTRMVVHEPLRGAGENQPVVPIPPDVVLILRRSWIHHTDKTVRVDLEDGNERARGRPVVDAHTIAALEHRLVTAVEPDSHFERINLGNLGPLCRPSVPDSREHEDDGSRQKRGSRPMRYHLDSPHRHTRSF